MGTLGTGNLEVEEAWGSCRGTKAVEKKGCCSYWDGARREQS